MYRNTYVNINGANLKDNVKEIIAKYDNYKYYFGVVKGNAYGHGDYTVKYLIEGGINYLAVSSLEEAISIRQYQHDIPILCLEPISLNYIDTILKNKVTITVESLNYLKELIALSFKDKLKVHLKLDTGMNRLGIKDKDEVVECIKLLKNKDNIILEGIYTHLATSGINDIYYDRQIAKFKELTREIDLKNIPIVHVGRSMTLVNHKKLDDVNGIRLGICLYGFNNSIPEPTGLRRIKRMFNLKRKHISESILTNNLNLKTAFTLYTEVMSLRKVKKGEFVGYGATYVATEDITVATLPIGYFDGINTKLKYVCIHNKLYEIIGEACMDMIMVKVDDDVKLHDKVEIFGDQISIKNAANRLGTNAYHLLTGITSRVPRKYGDKEIKY